MCSRVGFAFHKHLLQFGEQGDQGRMVTAVQGEQGLLDRDGKVFKMVQFPVLVGDVLELGGPFR